jgi:hypothetical protein
VLLDESQRSKWDEVLVICESLIVEYWLSSTIK